MKTKKRITKLSISLTSEMVEWLEEKVRQKDDTSVSREIRGYLKPIMDIEKKAAADGGYPPPPAVISLAAEPRAEYGARKTPVLANSHARKPHK